MSARRPHRRVRSSREWARVRLLMLTISSLLLVTVTAQEIPGSNSTTVSTATTTTTATSTTLVTATSSSPSSRPTLSPTEKATQDANIIVGLAAATSFLFLVVLVCAIYGFIRHWQKIKKDAARAHASINTSIPLSNPQFQPNPAAGGKGSISDEGEITTAPNPIPPNFAAAPTVNSPPKKHSKLKSIELVEGYRDSELASAIAGLQGKNLRPVSVDEAVMRAGPMQPSRVRAVDLHTVPDIEEIVVPMETLAWRFRRGPTGVWTTELGTSWWDERSVGVGWDGRWRVPAELKDNRVDPNETREDPRNRALSDSAAAPSGGATRTYGHPVRGVNTYQSIGSSVTRSNMVSAQVKRLFTWKRYYDFRAGGVGGYDAGLSGAICALEASDRREQFATFLDMLEETLMALSILEDSEGDEGVDEVYSNYNHNLEHLAHGGRMSPSSNASTMVARSVAESIARKLAAKTTQDAVQAIGLVQALGAVLVDMSIEAPSFKVNVGYMPSTYNEIPLEKNDLVTLFGLIDDRVGYGLNRRTNELGFVPLAHIDQHTVYQRPPDSYRPNPKRLSSRQLGLRQPGHAVNTNVIQRMAIANPTGHFRQGSTTNVGRQDVGVPPTDEELLEVLRTAGQAGSAGSGGSSGDGGVPNATRKPSVNSSITAGLADGKRYSIGQTIQVPAGYAPAARGAGMQSGYGRSPSPYTRSNAHVPGPGREDRQYRRAGMASPIPEFGRQPLNPNHPKFSDQGTPTFYHPGQAKGMVETGGRQEGRYGEELYEKSFSEVQGVGVPDARRKHSAGSRAYATSPVPHQYAAPPVRGLVSPVPHGYGRDDPRQGGFGAPQSRGRSNSTVRGYVDPNVPIHKHQRSQSTGSILSAESEGPYELPPDRPDIPHRVQHAQYPPPPSARTGVGVKHMQHRLPYSRVGQLSPIPASPSTPTSPIANTPSSHTSPGAGPSESVPPIPNQPYRYNLDSLGPVVRPRPASTVPLSPTGPAPPPPSKSSPTSLTSSSPPRSAKSPIFSTSSQSNTGTPATPATPRTLDYDDDDDGIDDEGREIAPVKSPALSAVLPQRLPSRDEQTGKAYELGPMGGGLHHQRPDSDEVVIVEDGSRWSAETERAETERAETERAETERAETEHAEKGVKEDRKSDDIEVR